MTTPQGNPTPTPAGELAALLRAGRFADLERRAREMIRLDPDSGIAWKALGVALLLQGMDAVPALERAVSLLPGDVEAHGNLANELQRRGRLEEAVNVYAEASSMAPHSAELCNDWGNALYGLKRSEEAVGKYLQALQLKPDFAEASNNLGNALRALGRLEEAVASYRRALDSKPRYPEALNNLGNALLDTGRFDLAAQNYRLALDIKPDFAVALSNLGNALRSLGRLEEAEASYRRALAVDASSAGAHINLGDVLRDLGRCEEAAASCRRAIEIAPGQAAGHNGLGNALMDLDRLDEAVESYRRALTLAPHFVQAHVNLGLALRRLGRFTEARACCQAALDANPSAASALVLLGELHADDGRFNEAEESFRRAAGIDPRSAEAYAGIASCRKLTHEDSAWWSRVQDLAQAGLGDRREIYLRFAMGKYCDDVRDYDRAFPNFQRAHNLRRRLGPAHDRHAWTRRVDRLVARFGIEGVRAMRSDNLSPLPVFIVGMPRSGTSLAEQILASHPSVFGAGELPFWSGKAAVFGAMSAGDTNRGESSARDTTPGDQAPGEAAGGSAPGGALPGDAIPGNAVPAPPAPTVAAWADDYLRQLSSLAPQSLRVVDKMPANFLCLGLIHAALPNARIIHMRRHPIDTCLSVYFQHFRSGHAYADNLDDLAHYYREYLRVMRHWRSVLPAEAILDVPYESLVDDQEEWSRRMLQFVGLPWDARCLDFHRTQRGVMTASKWQVRQRMNRTSLERWRNYEKFLGPLSSLTQDPEPSGARTRE